MDDFILINENEIDINFVISKISSPSVGALSTFSGLTRDNFEGKIVTHLSYEGYVPMAVKVLKEICEEIRRRWNVYGIGIVHRLGEVKVGECSVFIAISSSHRKDSLESCSFAINAIKAFCPIWKKENYSDGSVWKENKEASELQKGMNLKEFK
eukprot:c9269_g1_i1.p1 GENE.c9269_g1_i1~~c9269_g1_i1.p1  ORF type:complete len:154 (+),score=63.49 c9269_g1_i1:14-475(+)